MNALRIFLIVTIIFIILLRFFHFGEIIDDPHSWRQCDTANYIWEYYKNGIDLLNPGVCWMGDYKTVILECPLPEAAAALVTKIFGFNIIVLRLFFFAFYLLSVYYLYKITQRLYSDIIAAIASIVYVALPLGLFYSRTILIDFTALAFALGSCYYWIRTVDENKLRNALIATILSILAMLIKAPYIFYFALPMAYYIIVNGKIKTFARFSPLLLLPLITFFVWRNFVAEVNNAAPDWYFIPGYIKFVNMNAWYYGTLAQRLNWDNWYLIFTRLLKEGSGIIGFLFVVFGVFVGRTREGKSTMFIRLWLIGTVIYLAIFFNLNLIHNYYQIPFLPVFAVLIAVGIEALARLQRIIPEKFAPAIIGIVVLIIVFQDISYARVNYYMVESQYVEAGRTIQLHTGEHDLVLVSSDGIDCRNPKILYRAFRNGWSVPLESLDSSIVSQITALGAKYIAVVTNKKLTDQTVRLIGCYRGADYALTQPGWKVYIRTLQYKPTPITSGK